MVDEVVALLELLSAIGLIIMLIALALLALVSLLGGIGALAERAGDRWAQAGYYLEVGAAIVAGWVRSGAGILDWLAALMTGRPPQYYVERRRQAAESIRQTGLSAAQTQTDSPSARHNVLSHASSTAPHTMSHPASAPARSDAHGAPAPARNAPQAAQGIRTDAAHTALADVQVARILRHYRTAEALVEALLLAGWGVGQIRAVVRLDNNRVSEIAARVRGEPTMEEDSGLAG